MRVVTASWSVEKLFSEALSGIEEQMGEPEFTDDTVYRWRRSSRLTERVFELDRSEGTFEMEVLIPRFLMYLIVFLAVASLAGVLLEYQILVDVAAAGSIALYLVFRDFTDVPRSEGFEITSLRIAPVYFVSLVVAFLSVLPSEYSTSGVIQIVYVIAVIYILGEHYAEGSLPIDSKWVPEPGQSQSFLHIPALGLAAPLGSYGLFNVFNLLRTWPIPTWSVVVLMTISAVLGLWAYGVLCRNALWKVQRDRNKGFDSKPIQYLSLVLYVALNIVSLVILVFFVDIASFGLRGDAVVQNLSGPGVDLFNEIYANLDAVFEVLPLIAPRTASVLFFALVFLPTLFLLGIWVLHLIFSLSYKVYLLRNATPIAVDIEGAESVSIVSVNTGSTMIKPVTMFFGLKQLIIVSESVVDALDQDKNELQAVLAHEFYHLRNRERMANVISSVLAVGFIGGKNAVLSFYNYPEIERQADRFAVERYGATPLQTALRKIETLQSGAVGSRLVTSIPSYPGLLRERSETANEEDQPDQKRGSIWAWIHGVAADFAAPYHLFYGPVLFDEAHQPINDRIRYSCTIETAV